MHAETWFRPFCFSGMAHPAACGPRTGYGINQRHGCGYNPGRHPGGKTRELDIGPDGNWTDAGFKSRYQAELANGLGNLVNRSLSMLKRYRNGIVPAKSNELAADAAKAVEETRALLQQNQLQSALQSIWGLVNRANKYVDETAPFKLAKDQAQARRLDEVLYNLVETCRVLAVLLNPYLPGTTAKIYAQLGLSGVPNKFSEANWGGLQPSHQTGEPAPLFPRKDV